MGRILNVMKESEITSRTRVIDRDVAPSRPLDYYRFDLESKKLKKALIKFLKKDFYYRHLITGNEKKAAEQIIEFLKENNVN